MKKKLILGIIIVIVVISSVSFISLTSSEKKESSKIFHARLADPKMYKDGIFSDTFAIKNGTLQAPGTYYTWKYLGQDKIQIPDEQNMQIVINPHGNILGPVSVYIEK